MNQYGLISFELIPTYIMNNHVREEPLGMQSAKQSRKQKRYLEGLESRFIYAQSANR